MDNDKVVEAVNMLLTDSINHEKWEQAYLRYANNLILHSRQLPNELNINC